VGLNFTSNYWTFDKTLQQDKKVEAVFLAAGKDLVVVDYLTRAHPERLRRPVHRQACTS
jgi:hypothetical protein